MQDRLWGMVYKCLGISQAISGSIKEEILVWEFLKDRCIFTNMIPFTLMVYKCLGISGAISGSIKQEILVWEFLKYYGIFTDMIPFTLM